MKFMIKFVANWADEFECAQFTLMDNTYSGVEDYISEILDDVLYFGTNQGWEDGEIDRSNFDIVELTEDEWITLNKLFPNRIFGLGIL